MLSPTLLESFSKLMDDPSTFPWQEFTAIFETKRLAKKDHFIELGEESDKIALVAHGMLRLYLINANGEEVTHSFVSEGGACLNHFYVYSKEPSPVWIQAIEDTVIYQASHTELEALIKKHREIETVYRNLLVKNFMFKLKREMFFVTYDASKRLEKISEFPFIDIDRIPGKYLASFLGIKPGSLSRLKKDKTK